FSHLTREPEAPSAKAPRGWVSKEIDAFVLSLLHKDPARRPKDAIAVLDALDSIGRASAVMRAAGATIAPEKVQELIDKLLAAPRDGEIALELEQAVEQGADPSRVGDAFAAAAAQVRGKASPQAQAVDGEAPTADGTQPIPSSDLQAAEADLE